MNRISLITLVMAFNHVVLAQNHRMTLDEVLGLGLPVVEIQTEGDIEPTAAEAVKPDERCSGHSIANATKVPGQVNIWMPGHQLIYQSGCYEKGQSGMTIKIRGNNSALRTLKPYKIKLQQKADLLCRGDESRYADQNWLLLREAQQTLHTPIGFKVNELLDFCWTPQWRQVNLLFNGEYRGICLLTEQVRRNPQCRIDVDKQEGFIIERDIYWWVAPLFFESDLYKSLMGGFWQRYTYKYPDDEDVTDEQEDFIKDAVNQMEAAVTAGRDYARHMDVASFAAWTLGHDLLGTADAAGANKFLVKHDHNESSVFRMGTLWDFETNFQTLSSEWSRMHDYAGHYGRWLFSAPDKAFARAYVNAWKRLSHIIMGRMEEFLDSLLNSPTCEAMDSSRLAMYGPTNFVPVERNVEDALQWFRERKAWLDSHIAEIDTTYIGAGLSDTQSGDISTPKMVNGKWSNGKCFDLMGRRLAAPPAKGMYIENGRKRVVK